MIVIDVKDLIQLYNKKKTKEKFAEIEKLTYNNDWGEVNKNFLDERDRIFILCFFRKIIYNNIKK